MDYYYNCMDRDNDTSYSQPFYPNNDLGYRKHRESVAMDPYYDSPQSEDSYDNYFDRRSSYMLYQAYDTRKQRKYRNNEPVIPDDTGMEEDPFMDDMTRKNTEINSEIQIFDEAPVYDITPMLSSPREKATLKPKWYKGFLKTGFMKKGFSLKMKLKERPTPAVHVIPVNNTKVGDVLDSHQQREIIHQLYTNPSSHHLVLPPEKQKITRLDRIWVFRLWTESAENVAWVGFDLENQVKIEKHFEALGTLPEDGRLAIYDSHIRHKQMPVIITPNDKKGYYYFTDINETRLVTLEVTFIENNHQNVTFVYRV